MSTRSPIDRDRPHAAGAGADGLTRRSLLRRAGALGLAGSTLGALELLGRLPERAAAAPPRALPEIQFAIERFTPHAARVQGVLVRPGPVYTTFATFALTRTPTAADQEALSRALATIEAKYPFSPSGVFTTVCYGIPYFERLPGGMAGELVSGTFRG